MIKTMFNKLPPKLKLLIGEFIIVALKPFQFSSKIFNLLKKIMHTIGWYRVISKGDIVIQGGVDFTFGPSFIEPMSKAVGKNGLVIGIEPSPENIKYAKNKLKNNELYNNIILVNKAISNRKDKMTLVLGKKGTWNRLDENSQKSWKKKDNFTQEEISVDVDTIDNILKELKIDYRKISFVSLTINGQEYNALKGMKTLLKQNRNLSINLVAGRAKANPEIGIIDGKLDNKVISEFLEYYGFQTKYFELAKGKMGYVMAKKGDNKFFIRKVS
ncbi:MAG: FkbM family methyltransferase [Bacteroidales bacterium]